MQKACTPNDNVLRHAIPVLAPRRQRGCAKIGNEWKDKKKLSRTMLL